MIYEYWVVPAPRKGEKARGLKSSEERFAYALTTLLTDMGAQGWEYQRADALPCDERSTQTHHTGTYYHKINQITHNGIPQTKSGTTPPKPVA